MALKSKRRELEAENSSLESKTGELLAGKKDLQAY